MYTVVVMEPQWDGQVITFGVHAPEESGIHPSHLSVSAEK